MCIRDSIQVVRACTAWDVDGGRVRTRRARRVDVPQTCPMALHGVMQKRSGCIPIQITHMLTRYTLTKQGAEFINSVSVVGIIQLRVPLEHYKTLLSEDILYQ